ncbi:MAG: hypothetical protein P4L76_01365 [Beijerinckiaceae bacterium]|nr:hypothetical protein [Beijerinckiaceae bacterium]
MTENVEIPATIAAVASAVATAFAAYASWRAPRAAAELAERLRRDAERADERRRQKFFIFANLMQDRSSIYSDNAVKSLNLIDVVFHDSRSVREAWAELFLTFSNQAIMQGQGHDEKLRQLLVAMAKDLGLSEQFGVADLSRVYYPTILEQERLIKDATRQEAFARIQGKASPSANTAPPAPSVFPPKPE